MKKGKCRLCLKEKDLIESHIIPRSTLKRIKRSSEGFLHQISTQKISKTTKDKEYKEYLLCSDCDGDNFGRNYDNYFARFSAGETNENGVEYPEGIMFKNLDYKRFKNFLISTLWRMHHSKKKFFEEIDLGNKHEEIIRNRLFESKCFAENEYPVSMTFPLIKNYFHTDLVLQPNWIRVYKNRLYRFIIGGFLFQVHVGSTNLPKEVSELTLNKDGSLFAPTLDVSKIEFMFELLKDIKVGRSRGTLPERGQPEF